MELAGAPVVGGEAVNGFASQDGEPAFTRGHVRHTLLLQMSRAPRKPPRVLVYHVTNRGAGVFACGAPGRLGRTAGGAEGYSNAG